MATIFAQRPDPNYYINIQQHDDGNWSADQMALDDVTITMPMHGDVMSKGLRTNTKDTIDMYAFQSIQINAPPDMQRDALYIISQGSGAPGYASAKACMDWIVAMNLYRDQLKGTVNAMTFDQIVVFVVGESGWPALPANMPPKAYVAGALESRFIRPCRPKIGFNHAAANKPLVFAGRDTAIETSTNADWLDGKSQAAAERATD